MTFQIIGILILLIFYGCYFIKMFNQCSKGIQTDQIGKNKVGLVKFIEVTMKIITYIVPVFEVIGIAFNIFSFNNSLRIIGACMGIVGDIIFIISVITMQDNWRAGVSKNDKTELVTSGIYQISRNPAFLGFDLVYIGILLMFFNWVLFIVSLLAILMFHLQILNVGEEFLLEEFGDDYLNYKKKVCRYIGRKW